MAALFGQPEVIKVLHELGADMNAKNDNDLTPAHIAYMNGDSEMAQVLHASGSVY